MGVNRAGPQANQSSSHTTGGRPHWQVNCSLTITQWQCAHSVFKWLEVLHEFDLSLESADSDLVRLL